MIETSLQILIDFYGHIMGNDVPHKFLHNRAKLLRETAKYHKMSKKILQKIAKKVLSYRVMAHSK